MMLSCALIRVMALASKGSRKWLQIAINRKRDVLLEAMRLSGAVAATGSVQWTSPVEREGFKEYCDSAALDRAGIKGLKGSLSEFWPARGPVWDALGITSDSHSLFVEAKAHISEAVSPPSMASSDHSKNLIAASLEKARRFYAPRSAAAWGPVFYQYANRLAHHYFLTKLNDIPSTLVFLYFVNATDMQGPASELEWQGAIRLIHCVLGLPENLQRHRVFDVFVDVKLLRDSLE